MTQDKITILYWNGVQKNGINLCKLRKQNVFGLTLNQ